MKYINNIVDDKIQTSKEYMITLFDDDFVELIVPIYSSVKDMMLRLKIYIDSIE